MSEQKLEIFNVLNFLNNGYELEDILTEGNFGTFPSAQDCVKYLVDEGYLEGEFEEKWIHGYVRLGPYAVHLNLSQYCLLISYTPIQNKSKK